MRVLGREEEGLGEPTIDKLADQASMSHEVLRALLHRISQDRQIAYVWSLYDVYLNNAGSEAPAKEAA